MLDQYVVIGNPIAHSKSPKIHALFAQQTDQALNYQTLLAPIDMFAQTVNEWRAQGAHYKGANVTVPFKLDALAYATQLTERAIAAQAVNTLCFDGNDILGDNTDGIGLVTDITQRLEYSLQGKKILLLGAGGAARGVLEPLKEMNPAQLIIANRSLDNAMKLSDIFDVPAYTFEQLNGVNIRPDVIINATASGLQQKAPVIPDVCYNTCELAYDMMYGAEPTAFMSIASNRDIKRVSDGLGMLVAQAAEAFYLWRGLRPDMSYVYQQLRS